MDVSRSGATPSMNEEELVNWSGVARALERWIKSGFGCAIIVGGGGVGFFYILLSIGEVEVSFAELLWWSADETTVRY